MELQKPVCSYKCIENTEIV